MYHNPVLLKESIEALNIKPEGTYVDATFGGGGHSKAILLHLAHGRLFGFDQDEDARGNIPEDDRFTFVGENFKYLKNFLRFHGITHIDGLLADLGVSSHQFDTPERGFSTRFAGELDMRMDQKSTVSALQIINEYDEEDLIRIFKEYGELPNARQLSGRIIHHRTISPITTTAGLEEAIGPLVPRGRESKFMARIFQAIRLEVNDELSALKELLEQATSMLNTGGRLVFITYHSLEDRIVKNFFRTGNFEGTVEKDFFGQTHSPLRPVNRKPVTPAQDEIKDNNRARSAKLRTAEKI